MKGHKTNSKFAHHILGLDHSYGPLSDILKIFRITNSTLREYPWKTQDIHLSSTSSDIDVVSKADYNNPLQLNPVPDILHYHAHQPHSNQE
jgi:hypothetical protein